MSIMDYFSGQGGTSSTATMERPARTSRTRIEARRKVMSVLMSTMVIIGMAGQALVAAPQQAQAAPIAGFNSATDPDVIPMIGSFNWLPASYLTGPVDAKTVEINNGATTQQRNDAVSYEQYPYGRMNLSNTAYMGGLRTAYLAADAAGKVPLVNALLAQGNYNSGSSAYLEPEWASSDNAKAVFNYARPYCRIPAQIQKTGTASYSTDCNTASKGYPSGHSRIGWTEGIGLAIMLPEVAPQIMARTAEIVNGRVVLGVHSPLDVMAGRAIATRMIAHRMTDPTWKATFDAARTQLRTQLEAYCGKTIAACLTSSPVTMSNTDAINLERGYLTYGLPNVGATGVALTAPDYAYNLLEYAFPTKTVAERNTILAATAIDSGAPLDTTGSAINAGSIGWTRLDLGSALVYVATPGGGGGTTGGGADPLTVTKSVKDKATGSTTNTTPGSTLDYVVSAAGAGQISLSDTISTPQVLVGTSLVAPPGWTKNATGNAWTASGNASNYGQYPGTPVDVNLGTVSTTKTGGDGYVPVPYKDAVWGTYHYTLDGGYKGGSPVIWSADKKTGAMTSYNFGLGQRFLTPWIADPIRVGGKLYAPGFLTPTNATMTSYSSLPIGFACFDMDAKAPCATNWYPVGTAVNVTLVLSKGTSGVTANTLMRMASLGQAQDGKFRMTSMTSTGAMLYTVNFASGAPVVESSNGMNIAGISMQAQSADGKRIFTIEPGGTALRCTDTSTGSACAGWTNPTAISSASSSYRVIPVDVLNVVCVSDSLASPAYAKKCFDMATGAASGMNFNLSQNIAGPQFRFNAAGTKQYYGAGYGANGSIFCIDGTTGAACAGFGINGYAPVVGGVTDFKTYGVAADDLYPACMWSIGDGGQLYPFNAETGATGCGGAMATVKVSPPNLWCDGATNHIRGFTTLVLNGTVPTGNVTISVSRGGIPVSGWTAKVVPASASIDISSLPYQAGADYSFSVSFNGTASSLSSITVNMDQDAPQVCFSTTVPNDCTVTAGALTNQVNATMVSGTPATTSSASSNVTSITTTAGACVVAAPAITIVKKINGNDANTAPGVTVPGGSNMAITYDVENTGNVTLSAVKVTDDKVAAAAITCPKTVLAAQETMQCTASLAAPAAGVQHTNVGTVVGTPPTGANVSDSDPANAIVAAGPAISIIKKINGNDANTAPGVQVVAGSSMTITYDVKNEGNVSLNAVKVTDDKVASAAISCPKTTLAVGETMQCSASLTAPAAGGLHVNIGTVEGTSPQSVKVSDTDPANAFAPAAALPAKISGHVYADPNNNSVRDVGEGVISGVTITLLQGSTVVATTTTDANGYYEFANLAAGTYTVRETQPAGWLDGGEKAGSKGGTVTNDQIAGIVLVAGDDAVDYDFFEIPQAPAISIVKSINGDDANSAPGVAVAAGSQMAIAYLVKNEGNVALSNVRVTDDKVAATSISCPSTTLAVGASFTCTASLAAPAAGVQHTNTGTVVGTPPTGANVTDSDPANAHVAAAPAISIVKTINGADANAAPGVVVGQGSTMNIAYEVKNTGNVALSQVRVTDDKVAAAAISCPKATLAVGETITCTATLPAPAVGVQHTNTGTVEGTSPQNVKVTDTDPANAVVTPVPAISIVKKIEGDDANAAPGVSVAPNADMEVTFEVTNTGNTLLTNVVVTDDKIAAGEISCPKTVLVAGESMTCTASHPAPAPGVQHTNTGSVEGTSPQGTKVSDTDPANATVAPDPAIIIVKSINDDDANTAPGVQVAAGSSMAIKFAVQNVGNVALSNVRVTDDKIAASAISCPKAALAIDEVMICTASLAAPAAGAVHVNIGSVEGTSPQGVKVTDSDPANAHAPAAPAIKVVKRINGDDANAAPGVSVAQGSTMAVTFEVTNTGDVALSNVKVTDDKVAAASISCPKSTLGVGESITCSASLAAPAPGVQHSNTAVVTAQDAAGTQVSDDDPANAHVAAVPAVKITKRINGDDANSAPGVTVAQGSTMKVAFEVENTGNVALAGIKVTDDKIAASAISCPASSLAPGERMTCTADLAAPAPGVQHTNTGAVEGTSPQGVKVTDDDPANANVAAAPAIKVVKTINGDDANAAPGVKVDQGSAMKIAFEVENTGNVALSGVKVTDSVIDSAEISCPKATLAVGEKMTCTADMDAPEPGVQHTNRGDAEGTSPQGVKVTSTDPANAHVTAGPAIAIVKMINGMDANQAPGVEVEQGSTMVVTFSVTNTGNVALSGVKVTDDKIAASSISCPKSDLKAGETMVCTASLQAPAPGEQHANMGTVEGTSPQGTKVTADDPANAIVKAVPAIEVVKTINGSDANEAPGVEVADGSTMKVVFKVTNTGNVKLTGVKVVDDKIAAEAIECPKTELAAGESMECTADLAAPAAGESHVNVATATGTSPQGTTVEDDDPANAHVVAKPSIEIVKSINGQDANEAPGVEVAAGSKMVVSYLVTNTGNVPLVGVVVTDDKVDAAAIECPKSTLAPGESITCIAELIAPDPGVQHTNTGTVKAADAKGTEVTDADPANAHVKAAPKLVVVKKINGDDANEAPGVIVAEKSTMKVTFEITNAGNTWLTDVKLVDDKIEAGAIECGKDALAPGETMTCTADLAAPAPGVQHTNVATVTGQPADSTGEALPSTEPISDDDPANATVEAAPAVTIVKTINGEDVNTAPGVIVEQGSTLMVEFEVTNNGNVKLTDVVVTDDKIATEAIECPQTELAPGEKMVCKAQIEAAAPGVQHTNLGTVTAKDPAGKPVTDDDPANALVKAVPGISITKKINGDDANQAPGVKTKQGDQMTVTFEVKNTGNVKLTNVQISDDKIKATAIDCPKTELEAGESMVCTAKLMAPAAGTTHTNVGTVTGTAPDGSTVTASDPANASTPADVVTPKPEDPKQTAPEPKGTQTGDQLLANNPGLVALGALLLLGAIGAAVTLAAKRRREAGDAQ